MWYPAQVTTPATAFVSVAQVKEQCNITHAYDDAYLTALVLAAIDHVERRNSIRIATQTLEANCDCWNDLGRLPEGPVASISSITYVDSAGATQTLATSVYELRSDGLDAAIVLKYGQVWPSIQAGSRIKATMVTGFAAVPASISMAVKQLVAHWHANREPVLAGAVTSTIQMMVDDLLCNHRRGV